MKAMALAAAMLTLFGSCVSADVPRNIYGAHLLVDNTGERGMANLKWAKHLVGDYGFAKTLMSDITVKTTGPKPGWVDWVNECYKMNMIPVCRLAGVYTKGWIKPQADADGRYGRIAEAVKRVVEGLPKSDRLPLYIEVWNEPNLDLEWSGEANLAEYAHFFVDVSKAIRSLGDDRVVVMNGAFGLSAEATEECCKADPQFINAFDVWASHPYPQNHPPEYNIHAGNAKHEDHTIDAYITETRVLEKYGRKNVKVMITETGYALGNDLFLESEGYPAIDEFNRADYMLRAFRDYWQEWPEVIGVLPFEFSDKGWMGFNWVDPESGTRADGSPTKAHYQYTLVSKLAKPGDSAGSISGKVTDSRFGVTLENAEIRLEEEPFAVRSDVMGNFIRPKLRPGTYNVTVSKNGFSDIKARAEVTAGNNAVVNLEMPASQPGVLCGRVTDTVSGLPVSDVVIQLSPGTATTTTDENGRYELIELPPIPFAASAQLEGYNSHQVTRVVVEPNAKATRDFRIGRNSWPAAKNECSNASFELVNAPGAFNEIASRWEVQGQSTGTYQVVDGMSHSGDRCQSIAAAPGKDAMLRMISHYNYSKPGSEYTAGVWIRTENIFKAGGAKGGYLSLDFQTNAGVTLASAVSEAKLGGTKDWTYVEVKGMAPPSQRISVVLHLDASEGKAYFDDAYLAMSKPAPGVEEGEQ